MAPPNSETQGLAASNGDVAEVKMRFWALTFGSIGVVTIVVNTGISSASRSGWIERSISAVCG
jgi:hypothetical protein